MSAHRMTEKNIICFFYIELIINATKNTCNYTYAVYVLYYSVHCMEIARISCYG